MIFGFIQRGIHRLYISTAATQSVPWILGVTPVIHLPTTFLLDGLRNVDSYCTLLYSWQHGTQWERMIMKWNYILKTRNTYSTVQYNKISLCSLFRSGYCLKRCGWVVTLSGFLRSIGPNLVFYYFISCLHLSLRFFLLLRACCRSSLHHFSLLYEVILALTFLVNYGKTS